MFSASKSAAAVLAPSATNPPFNYVTLLLQGDGTNGAQNNTFVDSSSNNYTISRTGTATQGSFSPYGTLWSNDFSGSGQYLSTASNAAFAFGTGSFTVEYWINAVSWSTAPTVFDTRATGTATNGYSDFFNTTGQFNLYIGNSTIYTSTTAIPLNTWTHIAVSRQGTSLRVFINGVQNGSTVTNSTNMTSTNSLVATNVGISGGVGSNQFNGYISNLRVVKGTAVYTSNFIPSTTPLTAITNTSLLTCQSNRFRDASSNNFAITVTGAPSVERFSPFSPGAAYSTSAIAGSGYFSPTSYLSPTTSNIVNFGTGAFTVEMWMYANSGSYNFFDGRSTSGQNAITLFLNSDSTLSFLNANGTVRISGTGFRFGAWNHIAVTRTGTSTRLFLNGTQLGSTFTDSSSYVSGTNRPAIGAGGFSVGSSPYTGYLAGLQVVKGTAVYTANFTPPTTPPTAITNTALLLNFTNAGIFDNAMLNDLQTAGNAQVNTTVVKYGTGSMAFDGTGDFLSMPNTPNLNFGTENFTIEMWINFNSSLGGTFPRVITKGNYQASATWWGILITRSTGLISFNTGNPDVPTTIGNLANGVWTHIAVTRSGTTLRTFFNGVLNQTVTNSVNYESTFDVRVGSDLTGGENFAGYIDGLRITKGIAVYTTNFTPPTLAFPNN